MRSGAVTLAIASSLDDVFLVGAALHGIAVEAGLDEWRAAQVELAVVEGVNNAIEHAYAGRPDERVEVRVGVSSGRLTIEIADCGIAMAWDDACAAAAARLSADPLADGGRGLLIIREVMDEVGYRSDAGRNVLRLTKRIDHVNGG
ncbi:ATP-binding protein [bacterium]|nr:ATP-binding protein [bacterium]